MQFALRRMIERGIVARRADAAFIRAALTEAGGNPGRSDLYGTVQNLAGDTFQDADQSWPTNLWGRATIDGKATAGGTLRIVEGPGLGTVSEILRTQGNEVQTAVDLHAAGVRNGSVYEIDPPEVTEAATFFASVAVHVVLQFPADHALLPYFAVIQTADNEGDSPVGRLRRVLDPPQGPVRHELVSRWDETFAIIAAGKTPEETVWLGKLLTHLYRTTVRYFDAVYQSGVRLRGSGLRPVLDLAPFPVFVAEFTLVGTREKFALEEVEWLIDSMPTVAQATPQSVTPRSARQ